MIADFEVPVRNEHTGEEIVVAVPSFAPEDAQVEALIQAFREHGWRKCIAHLPVWSQQREAYSGL